MSFFHDQEISNEGCLAESKSALRTFTKKALLQVSDEMGNELSQDTVQLLMTLPELKSAKSVGVFLSMPSGEVQMGELIRWLFRERKRVFVPLIVDMRSRSMTFVELESSDVLSKFPRDKLGVPVPSGRPLASALDAMLIPGLGFDLKGNRLGRGAGFYDRALVNASIVAPETFVCGVCYDCQILPQVPMDGIFDRAVSAIVTPTRIHRV